MDATRKSYAIIPAAGRSTRMRQPKLLLPIDGEPLIAHVLRAWTESTVTETLLVARRDDTALREACRNWSVHVVTPAQDPVDMKQSVQIGLREIESRWQPDASDRCLIAPADLPDLCVSIIDRLLATRAGDRQIVVPRFGSRPGHPILLPWALTEEIHRLPADQGIDVLVRQHPVLFVDFDEHLRLRDLDTPEDYAALLAERRTQAGRDSCSDPDVNSE